MFTHLKSGQHADDTKLMLKGKRAKEKIRLQIFVQNEPLETCRYTITRFTQ